jgi:hypothetical protein
VLPRVVVRVQKAVRRLTGLDEVEFELSGERNERSWQKMLVRVHGRELEVERRLKRAERGLNRLRLN